MAIDVLSDLDLQGVQKITDAASVNKVTITAPATSATLTIADGATLTASATASVSGTNTGDNAVNSSSQPVDAELTAIAGLTSAADKGIQFTGAGTAATYDLTAAGKALLDDADNTAQRTTLGLGTLATQSGTFSDAILRTGAVAFTADQSMGGFKLTSVADGTASGDAINKGQLDAFLNGLKPKTAARVATTANITIATALNNGDVIDGITLATDDRVLVKDQTDDEDNGIYIVGVTPTRALDFDSLTPIDEINGSMIPIQEGTANGGKIFVQSGPAVATLDTDPINFVFFNSTSNLSGDDGITISGISVSVDHDGQGLTFVANQLALELDGSTLSKSGSGVKVSDATIQTITDAQDDIDNHIADSADAHAATAITNTPAGNIAATTVQAAINELDTEKQVTLVSGTNIKTINSTSLLGSGDIAIPAVKRFSALLGDTSTTNFVIAHGLATADLNPVVRRVADNKIVMVDTEIDATNVTLDFNTAPDTDEFRVTLVG